MPIRSPLANSFSNPSIWSIGMGSIAVVMLLVTLSQSDSLVNNDSTIVKPALATAAPYDTAMEPVSRTDRDLTGEQSDVHAGETAPLCRRAELQLGTEEVEVQEGPQQLFARYVQEAKLAALNCNKELSASLVIKARALLFGVDDE